MRIKRKNTDSISAVISVTVIATLAVVTAAASIAYIIREKCCRRMASENYLCDCYDVNEPIVPDDDEFEF